MKYLVRSASLIGFAELVEELGQSPLALLDVVGLPISAFHEPELYIPYQKLAQVLTLAAQRCATPDFGLRLGQRQGLDVVGALGTWLCLQLKVGDALALIQKNLGFHARGAEVEIVREGQQIALQMRLAFANQTDCHQLLGLSMTLLARCIAQLHGGGQSPLRVELTVPEPVDRQIWNQVFAVTPQFAASDNRLCYPASLLELPIHIDAKVRERLGAQWRGGQRQQATSLQRPVERAITALLPTGDCCLALVAQLLELKPRTLQAQLQQEQLSFGQLLKESRERART